MATLEVVNGSDKGSDAIYKLDRNIKALNIEVKNIDVTEIIAAHNIDANSHEDIRSLIPIIANDLTTQDVKQALSALQGYLLSQQINVLLPLLGSSTALKTAEELNNLKTNGEYLFYSTTSEVEIGGQVFKQGFVYNVKVEANLLEGSLPVVTQTITCNYSHVTDKRMLWRTFYQAEGWSPFNNVATTTKIDISLPLNAPLTPRDAASNRLIYSDTSIELHFNITVNGADIYNWNFIISQFPSNVTPKIDCNDFIVNTNAGIATLTLAREGAIKRGNNMPPNIEWIIGVLPCIQRA